MPERRVGITKDSAITFVELPAASGGRLDGGLVSDIYTRVGLPPRAIFSLESMLRQTGHSNIACIAPQYNPGSKLTRGDRQRIYGTDVLGLSSITRTITQTEQLAREYREQRPDGWVILGGVHGSAVPEECLEWADIVVRGEGEETLKELMLALEENNSPKGVAGVSYKDGDGIVHEPDREPLSEKQLAELPGPAYSEAVRKGIRWNTAWTTRGCTGQCIFCFVPIAYGECYRRKPNEANIAQLKALPEGRTFIIDDYFMGKPKQTKELLEMMTEEGLGRKNIYTVQLRAQAGLIPGAPELLRKAGIALACVGFESQSDKSLKLIGKTTTPAQNREGARALRAAGIRLMGMLMFGLDGDDPESIRETLEFAKEECDYVQIFAPGPIPGTGFAAAMAEQGRILTKDYFLYDGQNVIIRPKNFSPFELQRIIFDATSEFYSAKLLAEKTAKTVFGWTPGNNRVSTYQTWRDFQYDLMVRAVARRELRAFINDPQTQKHLAFLQSVS